MKAGGWVRVDVGMLEISSGCERGLATAPQHSSECLVASCLA